MKAPYCKSGSAQPGQLLYNISYPFDMIYHKYIRHDISYNAMIYQRYRLGTHATKCASYASSAASPQTVLSTSAVTSSHTLLGTHLVTSVVTSSRMGAPGTQCLVATLVVAWAT